MTNDVRSWYVLRCRGGIETTVRTTLVDRFGLECFVPMEKIRQRDRKGHFIWIQRCALTGYVFVRANHDEYVSVTQTMPNVRPMVAQKQGLWTWVVVPNRDMESFIRVAGTKEEQIAYLDPLKLDLHKGDRVRVIGGPFAGVEGLFMQVGCKHEKRVIIQLEGLIAVATAAIPASLVEKL